MEYVFHKTSFEMNRSNLWLNYDSKADSGFTDFTDPWFSHDMNSCQSFLCPPDPSLRPLYPMASCNYPDNFSDPWDENHSWLIRLLLSASVRFFCNCVFHGVYALFENVKIQGADFTNVFLPKDIIRKFCERATGTNPITNRETRETLECDYI